jgi:hypothetical protein
MPALDLTPVLVIGLLVVLLAVLVHLRDPHNVAPHAVSRWVWCAVHKRATVVEFSERVQTGIVLRRVRHCPLRRPGERCGDVCVWQPKKLAERA